MTVEQLDRYISNYILQKNPRYEDIEGAPFRIGQQVRILDNPNNDDTFDMTFANLIGEIRFFEYESGCGQSYPYDPLISVQLPNGRSDGFWKEELTANLAIPPPTLEFQKPFIPQDLKLLSQLVFDEVVWRKFYL